MANLQAVYHRQAGGYAGVHILSDPAHYGGQPSAEGNRWEVPDGEGALLRLLQQH